MGNAKPSDLPRRYYGYYNFLIFILLQSQNAIQNWTAEKKKH